MDEVASLPVLATLMSALDGLGHGVLIESPQREVWVVNECFCRLLQLGTSPQSLAGSDSMQLASRMSALFPEPAAFLSAVQRLLDRQQSQRGQRLDLNDGRTFEFDFIVAAPAPNVTAYCWVFRDITESSQAAVLLETSKAVTRGILAASLDCIVLTDEDGVILEFDGAVESTLGWRPGELVGRNIGATIVPAVHRHAHAQGMLRYQRERIAHVLGKRLTLECLRKDGRQIPIELLIREVSVGGRTYFAGYIRDLSEQNARDRKLEEITGSLKIRVEELAVLEGQSKALSDLAGFLHATSERQDVYAVLQQFGPRVFAGGLGTLSMRRGEQFEIRAAWGDSAQEAFGEAACWALRRSTPHVSGHGDSIRCTHLPNSWAVAVCVPISVAGNIEGVLSLARVEATTNPSTLVSIATGLAELLQLALSNLQLRASLYRESTTDALTGLYNRRHGEIAGDRILDRARRSLAPVAVAVVDIDHFKQVNDRHGHRAGDRVLKAVAEVLRESVRPGDLVFRLGGEEFVYMLVGTTTEQAMMRASQIQAAIVKLRVEHERGELDGISISQGIAMLPVHGETLSALFEQADRALYQAKAEGRNRVCVVPPLVE